MNGAVLLLAFATILNSKGPDNSQTDKSYTSIAALHSHMQTEDSSVTVRTTLTLTGNPAYIQDSTGGAEIEGVSLQNLKIGDQLLVTGNVYDTENGIIFRNSRLHILWSGTPVPPLAVAADQAASGKFADLLIEVQGRLLDDQRKDKETWLKLESGHQVFLARFSSEGSSFLLPRLERGSLLRLRGICSLQPLDTRYKGGFALLLRSAEDIDIISGPPWWSPRHLFELGLLIAGLIIAGQLALVQMLKARYRAIMAERARVGHELHDTLAQGFAGLSFQIQAARKKVPANSGILGRHLDLALDMVRHSHSEAHRSIMMLRPQPLAESTTIQAAIEASIEQMTMGCDLDVQFTTRGSVARLPLVVEDVIYRVAQEAVANALRHANPTKLAVTLDYMVTKVCLTVEDDGIGFDPSTPGNHGFGLLGMRERVRALHGTLNVVSSRETGTQVRTEILLRRNPAARLLALVDRCRSYYKDRMNAGVPR
ncbi:MULTISPECIES: sensor histidine kinase [Acidobacteriaceae]|uniref:sensor histidine kinase n=1 Tax=Acidobacteriaceae TaxID=204434 RepID=UPI00131C44AA|nr:MULTISPECIES: sensor histidine kinase [Acidobacteriaceae]MDW5267362.1 sensor histidine kinase [Edaphobacter sp.]